MRETILGYGRWQKDQIGNLGSLLRCRESTPGEAPPQIIEMEAVGAIAVLFENLSLKPYSAASGHAPLSSANSFEA